MADAASRSAKSGTKATKPAAQDPKAAAKEAKVKAKEARKSEKARKKASDNPADMGRIRQIIRAYQVTHEYDKALPYLLIGAFLLPTAISIVIGLTWGYAFNVIFAGVMLGILATMFMLVRRAKAATSVTSDPFSTTACQLSATFLSLKVHLSLVRIFARQLGIRS